MLKFHYQVSYHKKKKKNSLCTSLCSQKNIYLILPRCPGRLVGFPPQGSLFSFFFSLFFFKFFISEESEGNTNWLNGIQTPGPLFQSPSGTFISTFLPGHPFFASLNLHLAPTNTFYPKGWIYSAFGEAALTSAPGTGDNLPSQSGLPRAES